MYLKPYQITDISQPKPEGGRSLELDIYNAHLNDRQTSNGNEEKLYTYLNRPLRKATDSATGGLHLLHPKIDSGSVFIDERPWSGINRDGQKSQFGPQGWNYTLQNVPNTLSGPGILKNHNEAALDYSFQEEKDRYQDFKRYQDNVHVVSAFDKIMAEQQSGAIYSPPVERLEEYIDKRATPDIAEKSAPLDKIYQRRGFVDDVIPRDIELFTSPGFYGASPKIYSETGKSSCGYETSPIRSRGIYSQNIKSRENFALLGDGKEIAKNGHWYAGLILVFVILGFILCYGLSKNMKASYI